MRSTGPLVELTRYFLDGFVRPSFLGEHGEDALRRLLVTLAAATAMLGLFLPLPLFKKYLGLSMMSSGTPYREALLSDQILLLGVPMIIIGLAISVVAPSLYVDETDFLVLTPLPVSRASVFTAKLSAVAIFVALFVLAANTVGNLWFPAISGGRWATSSGLARMGTHTVASLLATSFVPIALAVLQGFTVTFVPRRLASMASTVLQALVLCALTAAVPMLLRMPGRLEVQPWMAFVPPCWFVGVSRYLLGDPDPAFARLAMIAVAAYGVAFAAVVICYAAAYLQYGRVTAVASFPRMAKSPPGSDPSRGRVGPATLAGLAFIGATVSRGRLNLLVLAGISAVGISLVVDTVLTSTIGRHGRIELASREVSYRAIAPTLMLVLAALVGLRATFLLPMMREANWIFRLIDARSTRIGLLTSVEWWFVAAGVGVPLIIGWPVQLAALGFARTLLAAPLVLLVALTLVEIVLREWRRVPFTCSYIPGKRHLAAMILLAWLAYGLFVYLAGHVIAWAILRPPRLVMIFGVLLALYATLRRRRLASPERASLEFEDEMPDVIRTLGLFS